jgi:hypothetical protein
LLIIYDIIVFVFTLCSHTTVRLDDKILEINILFLDVLFPNSCIYQWRWFLGVIEKRPFKDGIDS